MLFGILLYVGYRRRQQLPLTETVKVVTPEPLGVEEVEYKSVLVAFERRAVLRGGGGDGGAAGGAPRGAGSTSIAIVTVPTALPMDAPLEREEEEAHSKIERAKLIGGLRVTGPRGAGPAGPGGAGDRRRGARDQGGGDRDAAALPKRQARCTARRFRRCWPSGPAG